MYVYAYVCHNELIICYVRLIIMELELSVSLIQYASKKFVPIISWLDYFHHHHHQYHHHLLIEHNRPADMTLRHNNEKVKRRCKQMRFERLL